MQTTPPHQCEEMFCIPGKWSLEPPDIEAWLIYNLEMNCLILIIDSPASDTSNTVVHGTDDQL